MIAQAGPAAGSPAEAGALTIADLSVELHGEFCPPFDQWPDSYRPFLSMGSRGRGAVRFLPGDEAVRPSDDGFRSTYQAGAWQAGRHADRPVYRFHAGENRPYLWAAPRDRFDAVDIWLAEEGGRQMPPLLHPVDRVLFMGILAHRAGLIVHSCGWLCNGRALLFPGVSGAGKTTLCRQLMASGHGAVLSDDRMVLRDGDGTIRAYGTPWPGDAKQARNESAPLAGLCFIEKADGPRLIPIRPAEAFRRLLEAASIPWYDAGLRDHVLPVVERLVSSVPAYRLGFRPDPEVVEILLPLTEGGG